MEVGRREVGRMEINIFLPLDGWKWRREGTNFLEATSNKNIILDSQCANLSL